MGYRITYEPIHGKRYFPRRTLLTLMFFLLFLLLANLFWPEGILAVKHGSDMLKGTTVVAALEVFAEELDRGVVFSDAFMEFCQCMNQVPLHGAN